MVPPKYAIVDHPAGTAPEDTELRMSNAGISSPGSYTRIDTFPSLIVSRSPDTFWALLPKNVWVENALATSSRTASLATTALENAVTEIARRVFWNFILLTPDIIKSYFFFNIFNIWLLIP